MVKPMNNGGARFSSSFTGWALASNDSSIFRHELQKILLPSDVEGLDVSNMDWIVTQRPVVQQISRFASNSLSQRSHLVVWQDG
jgi:hypothetical protein